jgi:hypothetical protein
MCKDISYGFTHDIHDLCSEYSLPNLLVCKAVCMYVCSTWRAQ